MYKEEGSMSFELLPRGCGESSFMWIYQVVPGINAAFYEYNSPHCHVFNDMAIARDIVGDVLEPRRMFEVNVCREGTFRVVVPERQSFISLLQGDVALVVTDMSNRARTITGNPKADWSIDLPTSYYRGFGLIIDLALVESRSKDLLATLGINLASVINTYRLEERAFVVAADLGIERTVDAIDLHRRSGSATLLRLGTLELLARIDIRAVPPKSLNKLECSLETARLTREARNHALSNLGVRQTIGDISRKFGMSSTVFKNAFRKMYGEPYARYMTKSRMEQAEAMLAEGSLVFTVAEAVGYVSPSKFTAAFKRAFGESPSAYRERMGAVGEYNVKT
jgi:AraC-like DNA-binding protein